MAIVTCHTCDTVYDDTYRWTYCPHDQFEMSTLAVKIGPEGYEEKTCRSVEELHSFLNPIERRA